MIPYFLQPENIKNQGILKSGEYYNIILIF
jgi:hypothetical protein